MLEQLAQIDTRLFLFLNNAGSTYWDAFWLTITNIYFGAPVFILLLYFSYKIFGVRLFICILVFIILSITISDQLSNVFKNILVRRLRPCYNEDIAYQIRLVREGCGGRYGYFSAHASNSFTIATYFYFLFKDRAKWLVVLTFLWAAFSSYSRIYIGVHYPADVLTGMLIGIIVGRLFYVGLKRICKPQSYFLNSTSRINNF